MVTLCFVPDIKYSRSEIPTYTISGVTSVSALPTNLIFSCMDISEHDDPRTTVPVSSNKIIFFIKDFRLKCHKQLLSLQCASLQLCTDLTIKKPYHNVDDSHKFFGENTGSNRSSKIPGKIARRIRSFAKKFLYKLQLRSLTPELSAKKKLVSKFRFICKFN